MILDKSSYFLLGIKGAAMANIAVMLRQMGKHVSGVDVAEEFITDATLATAGITFSTDFNDLNQVKDFDVFVYSAAHQGADNPLALAAKKAGKTVISQPALIGELLSTFRTSIAVAGCHGKTTTSSLLAYALAHADKDPSYLIGAPPFGGGGGGKMTKSDYFVVEADEYGVHPPKDKTPKLLFLRPAVALCTNIDFDHPDVYDSIEDTKKTFLQFFSQSTKLVLCGDDPQIRSLLPKLKDRLMRVYGTTDDCDYQIKQGTTTASGISFELCKYGVSQGVFQTALFGQKNILNAAGAVAVLLEVGLAPGIIRTAIAAFAGAKRRLETVWTDGTSYLIDDYGHHPAEIAATIAALRSRFPAKKLHIIFQPHTFSRTEQLKDDFITALSAADSVYLLPIFASARENAAQFTITSSLLSQHAMHRGIVTIVAFADAATLLHKLQESWHPGDVVVTLGAGDVYKLKNGIISTLNEKHT